VVAELAVRVRDVDAEHDGRTALWRAVYERRPDNARVLAGAGAGAWRPMMAGWSPGRLSLAGPDPRLFGDPPAGTSLSAAEAAAVAEAARLIAALGHLHYDGTGLACVSGISADEAVRRLEATPVEGPDDDYVLYEDTDDDIVGVTDVLGGCVITQPWGYVPQEAGIMNRLSAGTVVYGLFSNPKSGDQGRIVRDGVTEGWDLHPGGEPLAGDSAEEILRSYLYRYEAVAYCCAYADLRPTDGRAVSGPPDLWVELPDGDHWR
jgi:hypothetical protein